MRLLLDESLPRPLADLLVRHDVQTVAQRGWTSLGNGALLRQAAAEFDALLTADQNIEFQQNLNTLPIAVVVLVADSNRLREETDIKDANPWVASVMDKIVAEFMATTERYPHVPPNARDPDVPTARD